MENRVIKVLTKEHGKKVIEWWKSQGVDTGDYKGSTSEEEGFKCIYFGVINGKFSNYFIDTVKYDNAKIIELPEDDFDMTTNEGRLAYAKKHYPVGTRYIPLDYKTGDTYPQSCESRFTPQVTISPYADYHNDLDAGNGFIYVHKLNKWAEIIKEEKMETQRLSRQGLKEIHSVACPTWKNHLEIYGRRNPLEDYIEFTREEVDHIFKACTADQLPIVSKYLKQDDGTLDLKNVQGGFIGLTDNVSLIALRTKCEYGDKSFWLNSNYNWEIKRDTDNVLCLIPTKKK